MPRMIDYELVLEQMKRQKRVCHYYNSGAFGFGDEVATWTRGWIGSPDETIRAEMQAKAHAISKPYEATLARLATRAWREHLPGLVWAMPKSHWSHELSHGSREWMPALLNEIGLDADLLQHRANAAAIEFSMDESEQFAHFVEELLRRLMGSDFLLAFVGHNALCTVHHHKQLWWMTTDKKLIESLDALAREEK